MEILKDDIDFSLYMRETEAHTKVKKAGVYTSQLKARLRQRKSENPIVLPWAIYRNAFEFRKGELTLWAGQNSSGKSLVTSQIALSLMGQGQKVGIGSFEMKPLATLGRMARMWIGMNPMADEFLTEEGMDQIDNLYDQFDDWTDNRLWVYDQLGVIERDTATGFARYCAKELGINHIIIDNMATCVMSEEDYSGQKAFISELINIARDYDVHIHLIHHLKKPPNEYAMPSKYDTKGSGAIVDLADNVWMVWRNKEKEDEIKQVGPMASKKDEPDCILMCRKQRNYEGSGNGEPNVRLWFHADSQQYVEAAKAKPMAFYTWPHKDLA